LEKWKIICIFVETNAKNMLGYRIKIVLNVLFITSVLGLAISYLTILLPQIPDLNFLEAVGVYCILLPINEFIKSILENDEQ
jgi:hypothetical protein